MGKFDSYQLPLKNLSIGTHEFSFHLDNQFFRHIDDSLVQKGSVDVLVKVKFTGERYDLEFIIEGIVQVPCDRCLDNMDQPINRKEILYVKLGQEYGEEGDNIVIIPREEGVLNIAWFLYEFVALSIPMKHVHLPGKCNKVVAAKLRKHTAHISGQENDEEMDEGEELAEELADDEEPSVDPRWDGLKKIFDNENDNN